MLTNWYYGNPTEGRTKEERPNVTLIDKLLQDTDMENVEELRTIMEDRPGWKECVQVARRPGGRSRYRRYIIY